MAHGDQDKRIIRMDLGLPGQPGTSIMGLKMSASIEKTDLDKCNLCGECIEVCAFGARELADEKMLVAGENCYGCSACEFACPEGAIEMVLRS